MGDSHARLGSGRLIYETLKSRDIPASDMSKLGMRALIVPCYNASYPCERPLLDGSIYCENRMKITYLPTGAKGGSITLLMQSHPIVEKDLTLNLKERGGFFFVNFGHWEVGTRVTHDGQRTLNNYTERLREWVSEQKDTGENYTIIWTDSTPFVPNRSSDDWRENARLVLMNQKAAEIAEEAGFRILEAFKVINPFARSSHDVNHYVFFQQDVLNHIRLNRVCPLPD